MEDQKLTAKLGLDTSEFDRKLDQADGKMQGFGKGMSSVAGKISAAFAGITAIAVFSKQIIHASEGLSDKFTFAVAGAKEAVWEFFNMIGRGDFNNFIDNLIEGYRRAKDLADQLDRLKDVGAYTSYITSGLQVQSAELKERVRDKTGKYAIAQRKRDAEELKKVEQQILDTTVEFADKTFQIEKLAWEGRNKMTTEEATKLFDTIMGLSKEQYKTLEETFNYEIGLFGQKKGISKILSGDRSAGTFARAGITKEQIANYAQYLDLIKNGEEEVIPKLYALYNRYNESKTQAQERYNGILRITNTLLEEEVIRLGGTRGVDSLNPPYADIKHLSPNQGLMPYANDVIEADISEVTEALLTQQDAVNLLSDAFMQLFDNTGDGFSKMVDTMIQGIERLLVELVAKAVVKKVIDFFGGDSSLLDSVLGVFGGGSSVSVGNSGGTPAGVGGASMEYLNVNVSGETSGRDLKWVSKRW